MKFPLWAAPVIAAFLLFNACSSSDSAEEPSASAEPTVAASTTPEVSTPASGATTAEAEATATDTPGTPADDSETPAATATSAAVTGSSGSSGGAVCDAGVSSNVLPGLTVEATLESGGLPRSYRVYVPTEAGSGPLPLVLAFHGLGGSGIQLERATGLTEVAEREKFAVVYPDGYGAPRSWRIRGTSEIFPSEVNDVQFVDDLLEALSRDLCFDESRVYATGHSNGAFMSSVLACERPDTFAAIAPVAGLFYPAARCDELVPTLAFHSTDDRVVPFLEGLIFGSLAYDGPRAYLAEWAETGGCSPIPYPSPLGSASIEGWDGCTNGAVASLVVIDGGDHGWPVAATHGVSASDEAWAFFEQWTK
jgi:polyhydroxybutyrate depolymerase